MTRSPESAHDGSRGTTGSDTAAHSLCGPVMLKSETFFQRSSCVSNGVANQTLVPASGFVLFSGVVSVVATVAVGGAAAGDKEEGMSGGLLPPPGGLLCSPTRPLD